MALTANIKTILTSNTTLYGLVADRIYPVVAPEKPELPCIVFIMTSLQPNESKTYANKWDECQVNIIAIATTHAQAETIGNLVRTAVNRYTASGSDKMISGSVTDQSWELVPDFSYQGATTGVSCFAVNTNCKIITAQNIAE